MRRARRAASTARSSKVAISRFVCSAAATGPHASRSLGALFGRKDGSLGRVDADRDDEPVDEAAGLPDHVEMAVRDGSKVPV